MKFTRAWFVVGLPAALVAFSAFAQVSQPVPAPGARHVHPAPTNLKVLPKDLTGEQVDKIMHTWNGQLGTNCAGCHKADPSGATAPNGRPKLIFTDDSRPEMAATRRMVVLTSQIDKNPNVKAGSVTCGTCHRGHFIPEDFKGEERYDHQPTGQPAGPQQPPQQH